MPDKFDLYREALVVESNTIWPEEIAAAAPDKSERRRIQDALHADPSQAGHLEYVRLYTGFCRQITVTAADLERLRS
jgi:hypothetical protein